MIDILLLAPPRDSFGYRLSSTRYHVLILFARLEEFLANCWLGNSAAKEMHIPRNQEMCSVASRHPVDL